MESFWERASMSNTKTVREKIALDCFLHDEMNFNIILLLKPLFTVQTFQEGEAQSHRHPVILQASTNNYSISLFVEFEEFRALEAELPICHN